MSTRKAKKQSWWGLGLLLLFGCGLSDYEDKFDKQNARMKEFDEQMDALGPPLVIPKLPSKWHPVCPLDAVQVFLCPPKNINSGLDLKTAGPFGKYGTLYRYSGTSGFNLFLAADDGKPIKLPPEQKDDPPPADFVALVMRELQKFHEEEFQQPLIFPQQDSKVIPPMSPLQPGSKPRPELHYQSYYAVFDSEKNSLRYFLYFTKREGKEVAVIFQLPKEASQNPDVLQAIATSLRTLEVGPATNRLRINFSKILKR